MNTPDIRPDRRNWRLFCQEDEPTTEENHTWREMADAILTEQADGSHELLSFIATATATESRAETQAELVTTKDWSDLVQSADARRRRMRAELAAWARWQEQETGNVS